MEMTLTTKLELDSPELTEVMKRLTGKEREFVLALVFKTNGDQTEAAEIAGYSTLTRNSLRVNAHSVAHRPHVQAAIQEVVRAAVGADTPAALYAVRQILFNPNSKTADKLKAAKMILDKGGIPDKQEIIHSGTVHMDVVQRVKEIRRRAEALGIDPRKILGQVSDIPQNVIDAEFEVVTVTGAEGLEDVL